ncbi:MAG: SDR family NAD(P)-dependent oxidoreductase [Desulfobacteraceae bacterium]|nr:SDR family NAD(P)-dependent oxidoreductase [Desulfobacteraceae bacterium]
MKTVSYENKGSIAPIAIVGMGCFFAKSSDLKSYWRLLLNGIDGITDPPGTHDHLNDYFDRDPKRPDHIYCNRGGYLSPVDFDPTEFGIPPNALEATDTSQLLGLLAAKHALEDAGYGSGREFDRDRTSVILGVTGTQELVIPLSSRLGHPKWRKALEDAGIQPEKTEEIVQGIAETYVPWQENSFPGLLGNVVAGRICNRLDLRGTNCVVDAACASSMSAINLAILELSANRSHMVVTGGVDTLNDIFMHMCFSKTAILSPTGDIRPFSKEADGTVLGEGVGLMVLKRLSDAEKDGDRIYAVIRGIGSSSDGKSQSIYAPLPDGQERALRHSYATAGYDPSTVDLVEAHGTGTRVGDQVEFQALTRVFATNGSNGHRRALGSVKSMIGHAKAAAGSAGLIKAALGIHHKVLPPTLKADTPDDKLNIPDSPFYLNTRKRPWFSRNGHPRRAGISAFGFGGSNYHVAIEEYHPQKQQVSWDGSVEIIALGARDHNSLSASLNSLADEITVTSIEKLPVVAATSRKHFNTGAQYRLLMVVRNAHDRREWLRKTEAAKALLQNDPDNKGGSDAEIFFGSGNEPGRIACMFPGQGSQYVNMGLDLACMFPEAFGAIETANEYYDKDRLLSDAIFPCPASSPHESRIQEDGLRRTDTAQPAIGAVSLAYFRILERFGISPDAVLGHSYGELTALRSAGWMDDGTFFDLSVQRGRLMAAAGKTDDRDPGTMLAVKAPLTVLDNLVKTLDNGVMVANRNGPEQGVLSGSTGGIEAAMSLCKTKNLRYIKLPVAAAFHSPMVRSAHKPFADIVGNVHMTPGSVPVQANLTASRYPDDPKAAKSLLADQLVNPVRFQEQIENLYSEDIRTFVEVGPKPVLTGLVRSILDHKPHAVMAVDASAGKNSGVADLAAVLCRLAAFGHHVDLSQWEDAPRASSEPKMRVPMTGANYIDPKRVKETRAASEKKSGASRQEPENSKIPLQGVEISPQTSNNRPSPKTNTLRAASMTIDDKKKSTHISETLAVVQQGLQSMQALQQQTALAHQKFLDTQTQANRTLQEMMRSTQQLAAATLGLDLGEHLPAPPVIQPVPPVDGLQGAPRTQAPAVRQMSEYQEPVAVVSDPAPENPPAETVSVDTPAPASQAPSSPIEPVLLDIVSELTGYPAEMLDTGMDIEADLGIDSIKRVEILSTLEERMPGLPQVTPDMMGTLKTLGQIVAYLSTGSHQAAPAPQAAQPQVPASMPNPIPDTKIRDTLVHIVSELTGYPADMLDTGMDIEADLGIDSIKRVEILSTLEERMPGLPQVTPDMMGTLKTLGQIVEFLSAGEPASQQDTTAVPAAAIAAGARDDVAEIASESIIHPERRMVTPVMSPLETAEMGILDKTRKTLIVGDGTGFDRSLCAAFEADGYPVQCIEVDHPLPDVHPAEIAGVMVLPGVDALRAFQVARHFGPDLNGAAENAPTFFLTISRMDGSFGFSESKPGCTIDHPEQGALAGLTKTADIEWQKVICRALDIDPQWGDDKAVGRAIIREIVHAHKNGSVEIGLGKDHRIALSLTTAPVPDGDLDLGAGDVVVVSGGARGVTAASISALSKAAPVTFILLGRSPEPATEPIWLNGISGEADMKSAILRNQFPDTKISPKQLESVFSGHLANRQIRNTLNDLREAGAKAHYHSVDIRQQEAVTQILETVRAEHGPVRALIHGAGVLEDRLIVEKTDDQFQRVLSTKVDGLSTLLQAVASDALSHIVLFSSVSARMGNKGQADYAMANEILNKTALREASLRPDCRVVSINWGPWDGGMVSPALKREFEKNDISLINVDAGAKHMVMEMSCAPDSGSVEVVVGNMMTGRLRTTSASLHVLADKENTGSPLSLFQERHIDLREYPILEAHQLDGKPVVPFALLTEWLGQSALHENPGLMLRGIDDMRLLNGIKLDEDKKTIRMLTGKASKCEDAWEVWVEIQNGNGNDGEMVHSRAKAVLSETLPEPPVFTGVIPENGNRTPMNVPDIYEKVLFHKDPLKGIQEVLSCTESGLTARLLPAPSPEVWMRSPLRSRWIGDPLILDAAFQMASVWCYEHKGMVSLPSYAASYRQYRSQFPSEPVTAVLEVTGTAAHKMTGNFTFLDRNLQVIAQMTGYEAVMDASLYAAFKPERSKAA